MISYLSNLFFALLNWPAILILVDLLASGTYEASATVNYADGSQMTCIQAKIDVTSGF